MRHEAIGRFALFGALVLALGLSACRTAPDEPKVDPLPDELVRLIHELEGVPLVREEGDMPLQASPADPDAPAMALRTAQDDVRSLLQTADPQSEPPLRATLYEVEQAWQAFAAGSPDLDHLGMTTDALHRAEARLKEAWGTSGPDARSHIVALQAGLADVVERMARTLLRRAKAAGVRPASLAAAKRLIDLGDLAAEQGDYEVVVGHFGNAVKLAANTITFDVALFEQNIIDALAGQTTGHAFSIAHQGLLFESGESSGLARTAADPPSTAQSPGKETHVASVSKTLTAIVVQRRLDEEGLTPETPVAPFLPGNWVLGEGVDTLSFRHFMTHRSGFGQLNVGNDYQSLQTAIATDVGNTGFSYQNSNFGLMRVLVAGLMGIDPVDYPEFEAPVLTASAFLIEAQEVYDPIGVEVDCTSNDDTPTVQYNFPDGGSSGYLEPNRQLTCGGIGWFISSNELAAVLTNLRNTENLLSAEARATMQEDFLGYMDPANYGCGGGLTNGSLRICGDLGVYYMHGGDWRHTGTGGGELHACAVAFPIELEVGLVINSERGFSPYQCNLLQTAFHDAWVAD